MKVLRAAVFSFPDTVHLALDWVLARHPSQTPPLTNLALRPRYELRLAADPDSVVRTLRDQLLEAGAPCVGMVAEVQRVVDLRMRPDEKHLWSPALTLQIEADPTDQGGTLIRALIGPEPGVWTGIAFSYLALATGLLFTLTFGIVQNFLGQDPWSFWLSGAMLLGLAGVWFFARAGRQLATPQTLVLRHFVEDALELSPAERAQTDADPYHA